MRSRLLLLRGINSDQKKSFENLGLITNFRRKYISSRKIIFLFSAVWGSNQRHFYY